MFLKYKKLRTKLGKIHRISFASRNNVAQANIFIIHNGIARKETTSKRYPGEKKVLSTKTYHYSNAE